MQSRTESFHGAIYHKVDTALGVEPRESRARNSRPSLRLRWDWFGFRRDLAPGVHKTAGPLPDAAREPRILVRCHRPHELRIKAVLIRWIESQPAVTRTASNHLCRQPQPVHPRLVLESAGPAAVLSRKPSQSFLPSFSLHPT